MNALNDAKVAQCLERLHEGAREDSTRRATRRADEDPNALTRMGDLYLAVSRAEGRLLYLLARGAHARAIFEFGASFGVSTVYLAAAARDNGGTLITTEVHPDKCAAVRRTLDEAGLASVATVLEGDARETVKALRQQLDFAFLDGWKSLYLPMLKLLVPNLRAGALIAADNIDHEAAADYAQAVRSAPELVSHTLGKMERTCYTGSRHTET